MPTYQYACTECDERLEVVQSFSDAALTECPRCSGRLRKVFSAVGVVFKGSGFYKTDSRSGSSSEKSTGDKGGDKPAASADKGSSDKAASAPAAASSTSSSASSPASSTPAAKSA